MPDETPTWLRPSKPPHWGTEPVTVDALRFRANVRIGWSTTGAVHLPTHSEIDFRDDHEFEGLKAHLITGADPHADLAGWVPLGSGIPASFPSHRDVELLEWSVAAVGPEDLERLAVDELHAYTGVAKVRDGAVELARSYVLAARRASCAWKFELILRSACPPGTSEQVLDENDHVRAGAILGGLHLD